MIDHTEEAVSAVAPAPERRAESLPARFAKTVAFWPREDDHSEESPALAWVLIGSSVGLGIAASTVNLFFGLALAVICLHGSALARYVITR